MLAPAFGRRKLFKQLTLGEREIIRRMLTKKVRVRDIARLLGKDRSTVFREIRRNTNAGGLHVETRANGMLKRRRLNARAKFRIVENDGLLEGQIDRLLRFGLSPEQIAGYLLRTRQQAHVSRSTVYRWVHRAWQGRKALLRFNGKTRVPYGSRKNSWDPDKRHISQRPAIVEKRERVGDWEADLVHGVKDNSHHCLLTLNDRATGFCIIRKVTALDSNTVAYAIIGALDGLPVKTITCDNGFELGRHKRIECVLKRHVYFTDTNSPQQRGSNENLNGLVRQFFPKGRSMRHVTQAQATAGRASDMATKHHVGCSPR